MKTIQDVIKWLQQRNQDLTKKIEEPTNFVPELTTAKNYNMIRFNTNLEIIKELEKSL